jgi:hypothetical protein
MHHENTCDNKIGRHAVAQVLVIGQNYLSLQTLDQINFVLDLRRFQILRDEDCKSGRQKVSERLPGFASTSLYAWKSHQV